MQCGQTGHLKCTLEKDSQKIKIDAKVMNDLDEFIINAFRGEDEEEQQEVDEFDYIKPSKKKKKLTKLQKK